MNPTWQTLAEKARRLAAEMPAPLAERLAEAICQAGPGWRAARGAILSAISQPHYRALATDLLDAWERDAPDVDHQAVALTLVTAAESERAHREAEIVELVWTGPDTGALPLRRTEQVLLQVIDGAGDRLTLVSYAVYDIPRIREALVRSADRGVALTLIIESPDPREGENAYDALKALGPAVAARSAVYLWPREHRPRDEAGRAGSMHVKCAVADGRRLFLSSANLTAYAFALNMEMGVLITGGPLPGQVEAHLGRLITTQVLTKPV
jgi:phosphatidylserine/phosphatidylglycerophosphate/cardiolipin synthase-like enzyme